MLMAIAIILSMPLFVVFGALSDRIGRKWMIIIGMTVAVATYIPIFKALTHYANPALEAAQRDASIVVRVDPTECSFQGSPIAREIDFRSSCDIAKRLLARSGVSYRIEEGSPGTVATITVGSTELTSLKGQLTKNGQSFDNLSKQSIANLKTELDAALSHAGYPKAADPASINTFMVCLILFALMSLVAVTYAPLAAYLCELFPARIRYTSLSLPVHIATGWFGGLLPTIAFALVAQRGDMYSGLQYPIIVAGVSIVIGTIFLRDRHQSSFDDK